MMLFYKFYKYKLNLCTKNYYQMSVIDRQAEKHKYSKLLNASYKFCMQQLQASKRKSFWARLYCCCEQNILGKIVAKIEENISKHALLEAQGMIIAVYHYRSCQLKDTRMPLIYHKLIFEFSKNLNKIYQPLQKIICLQKLVSVLEENEETKNNQMLLLGQQLNCLADAYQQEDKYTKSNNPKIAQTYKKIYKLFGGKYDVSKWLAYESQQKQPNYQSIIQTVSENPSQAYFVLVLIRQKMYKQAWHNLLKTKRPNQIQYVKFLTFIDLQMFSEANQLIKDNSIDPLASIIFKEAVNQMKQKYVDQNDQEKVTIHLKCIEFYEQNRLYESLTFAYRNLIKILTLSDCLQSRQVNAKNSKAQQILGYYQKLLHSKSNQKCCARKKQEEKTQYMGRIFSSIIQTTLQQTEPNYRNLLKIRQRYFDNDLGDSLLYICAGNYQQARVNADCCNLNEKADQQALKVWKIADLMDKRRYTEVRQATKELTDRSKENWMKTLLEKIEELSERPQQSFLNILND